MKFHLINFKKTSVDNIFEYTDINGTTQYYDFTQLQPLETTKIRGETVVKIDDEFDSKITIPVTKLVYHRFLNCLPNGFRRLTKYGKHTFFNKFYYYNSDTNEIIVQKTNDRRGTHFLVLIPSKFNRRIGYTITTDESKSIICFPQLID